MTKFNTPEAIIDAFKNDSSKAEFMAEWNDSPVQRDNLFKETLRYKVITSYWEDIDGKYKDVMDLLAINEIPLLRNQNPIYALDDKEVVEESLEELQIFMGQFNFDNLYSYKNEEDSLKIKENLKKATTLYLRQPELFGKLFESQLLEANLLAGNDDTIGLIAKSTNRLPYSSQSTRNFIRRIIQHDNVEILNLIYEANPKYLEDIGKIPFHKTTHNFPEKLGKATSYGLSSYDRTKYRLQENALSHCFYFNKENVFKFLLDKTDISLSGAVDSCAEDVPYSIQNKTQERWGACRYNLYKRRVEAYKSDKDFIPNDYSSLLFNVFAEFLDEANPEPVAIVKEYLNKAIESGEFISLLKDKIKTWESEEKNTLKLDKPFDSSSDIRKANTEAHEVLFQIKEARKIIYSNAGKILKNTKDNENKYDFFLMLVKNSRLDNDSEETIHRNVTVDNAFWQPGKNLDNNESFIEVLSKYAINLNQSYEKDNRVRSNTLQNFENKNLTKLERDSFVQTSIYLGRNKYIADADFIFYEQNIIDSRRLKILMNTDLTYGGKENPLYALTENNNVEEKEYTHNATPEELKILGDERKKKDEKYVENLTKILEKCFKDKSLTLLTPSTEYDKKDYENILSSSLKTSTKGSILFWKALKKEHIDLVLQGNLLNNNLSSSNKIEAKIKNKLLKTLNDNVSLTSVLQVSEQEHFENVIRKLHKSNFDFSINIDTNERAYSFIKIFAVVKDKELLSDIFNKYEPLIRQSLNMGATQDFVKYGRSKTETEKILNIFQNEEFYKLFNKDLKPDVVEALVRMTNSKDSYLKFLNNSEIDIVNENRNLLWETLNSHSYGPALAIIELYPDTIETIQKNKLPLETALRDNISFSTKKGKYENSENAKLSEEFVLKIADYEYSGAELAKNKKALTSLLSVISSNKNTFLNEEVQKTIYRNILNIQMSNAKPNKGNEENKDDIENNSFKL